MLNSLHQFYHLYLRPGLHICELESMPQKSIFSLSIPPTDLLTYLFPPDATPSDQPLYISADQPTSHFLSQAETLVWVKQLALGFQKLLGLTGDRKESNVGPTIMILSPNHVFVPVVYLAAIAAGGIFCGCSVSFGVRGECCTSLWQCVPASISISELTWLAEVTYQLQNAAAEVFLVHPKFLDVALQAAQNAGLSGDKIFLLDQDPHPHGGKPDFRTILASREEARHWQWKKLDQEQAKNTTAVINYSSGFVLTF